MNRHICRGKEKGTGRWVYGYLNIFKETVFINDADGKGDDEPLTSPIVDSSTLGQYTGFVDVTTKFIFEGDIVEMEDRSYRTVIWSSSDACFKLCRMDGDGADEELGKYRIGGLIVLRAKIIGNVHNKVKGLTE